NHEGSDGVLRDQVRAHGVQRLGEGELDVGDHGHARRPAEDRQAVGRLGRPALASVGAGGAGYVADVRVGFLGEDHLVASAQEGIRGVQSLATGRQIQGARTLGVHHAEGEDRGEEDQHRNESARYATGRAPDRGGFGSGLHSAISLSVSSSSSTWRRSGLGWAERMMRRVSEVVGSMTRLHWMKTSVRARRLSAQPLHCLSWRPRRCWPRKKNMKAMNATAATRTDQTPMKGTVIIAITRAGTIETSDAMSVARFISTVRMTTRRLAFAFLPVMSVRSNRKTSAFFVSSSL